MEKIWEKQEYETDLSYRHFQKYYLLQTAPRTLTKAYRGYLVEKGKKTEEEAKGIFASSSWQKWYAAKSSGGEKLEGSYTWKQRADAYDEFVFMIKEKDFIDARQKLVKGEMADGDSQMELWTEIFDSFALHVRRQKQKQEQDGFVYDPSKVVNKAQQIWKWRDEIAAFKRRSLGLPLVVKDKQKEVDKDKAVSVKWDEPLDKNEEIGVGGDELDDKIDK
jgi:hypothetical protein